MRCTSERSGAARRGLENDSVTGGMGGDYTSWGGSIKAKHRNSAQSQLELEHCRA
jgi:hypothetical protein